MDASRSILLGGREWRSAVDQPMANETRPSVNADDLAAAFAAAWGANRALPAGVGAKLVALCQRARQAHQTLPFDERELAAMIAARAPAAELDAYFERCHPADLALALSASRGWPVAILSLERTYRTTIDSTCRRFVSATHTAAELKQILRSKLFAAASGKTPKIADYAGQGSLENWLRVTAVRIFLDLGELPGPNELAIAAGQLEPGDRHLLRQHLVAGLSIDQLAAVLGIHRKTVARRITRAREQLRAGKPR